MEVVGGNTLLPGDPRLIDHIVCELKSQGIFDQFRKECIADVDTKPAYQNLRQRVEGSVTGFLKTQTWRPDMNKNQLREMLRKNIYESGFLETGVERIVDQVVNPKINTVFLPQVEEVVYKFLGLEKPARNSTYNPSNGPLTINTVDLLPTDLDPISPDSEVLDKSANKPDKHNEIEPSATSLDDSKNDEFESPPFEPITEQTVFEPQDESSNDSKISGISGLTSHDSNMSDGPEKMEKLNISAPDINNPDSQLSKVSSNSRLSIVTTDSKHTPEKMDISDDTQGSNSKSEPIIMNTFSENDLIIKQEIKDELEEIRMEINGHNKVQETEIIKTDEIKPEIKDEDEDEVETKMDVEIKTDTSTENQENIKDETESKVEADEIKTETKKSDRHRNDSEKRRDKDKKSSDKDKKDKYKSSSSSSSRDKETSSSSSKDKDRHRDKSKDSKSTKDSKTRDDKDKNKDSKSKSSSSSKHTSRDRNKSSSKSDSKSSKDRDHSKSSKDKPKSDDSKSSKSDDSKSKKDDESKSKKTDSNNKSSRSSRDHSRSESSKHSSSHSSKDRKSSSSNKDYRDKKDSKKSSKRDKDDHSSSRDKKSDPRRSADRDSNDGSSGVSNNNNNTVSSSAAKEKDSSSSSNKSKSDSSDSVGSNSGDSGQSDNSQNMQETVLNLPLKAQTIDLKTNEIALTPNIDSDINQTQDIPVQMKLKKPKIASNIFEVRKLMKIRKKMEKLEKKRQRQQELAAESNNVSEGRSPSLEIDTLDDTDSVDSETLIVPPQVTEEPQNKSAIVSKASWDAIEAKLSECAYENVNFNSYADDTGDSSSNSRLEYTANKRSSEDEDCLYFNDQVSPTTERFLKTIENYKKNIANQQLNNISKSPKRLRKPNVKNNLNDFIEYSYSENSPTEEKNTKKKIIKGKKRKIDGDVEKIDSENNNKKINNSHHDILETMSGSPSSSNLINGSIDTTVKTKPRTKKNKKTVNNSIINASNLENDAENKDIQAAPTKYSRASLLKNQRYSSDDLYKPRPVVSGTSRRQRGLLNNADKKN